MTWICAACGHPHDANDPPCRKCAGEQFALVDEKKIPDRVDSSIKLEWHCKQCGAAHQRNSPPCTRCGSMMFEAVYQDSPSEAVSSNSSFSASANQTNYQGHSGGLFRKYVFDAGHVRTWEWIVMGLFLLGFPPVGFFIAGWILIGCFHKVDDTGARINPNGRSSGGLFSLILMSIGALVLGSIAIVFLLIILS